MSKKNQLKGIAYGLLGTFVSRNNDIDGYWGIGVLCLHSKNHQYKPVILDLIRESLTAARTSLNEVAVKYAQIFRQHLVNRGIPFEKVRGAETLLKFNLTEIDRKTVPQPTHGTPYSCTVTILGDHGKVHTALTFGWCDPHDPARESRRNQIETPSYKKSFWSKFFW